MKSMTVLAFALAVWTSTLAACTGASTHQADAAEAAQEGPIMRSPTTTESATPQSATLDSACVANLPFSRGKSFCCLDEYLAHLEQQGAIDLPWWRQISPGMYERIVRMPGAEREIATRQELMRRFGFSC